MDLPFLYPKDLPNLGTEPRSSALQVDSLPSEPLGNLFVCVCIWSSNSSNGNYQIYVGMTNSELRRVVISGEGERMMGSR